MRFTPDNAFETFPFPENVNSLEGVGKSYYEHRRAVMDETGEGLTKIYNRFHDQSENSENIVRLRELRVQMDDAVANAYGWDEGLEHGFHQGKKTIRFGLSDLVRRTVLQHLLKLNHQRFEQESLKGLHDKKKKKTAKKPRKSMPKKSAAAAGLLFDDEG